MRDPDLLFVYGTLRRASGHEAHGLLAAAAVPVGEGWVRGDLHRADGYPCLVAVDGATGRVRGEVYRLTAVEGWTTLDRYEHCDPVDPARGLFRRVRAQVTLDDGRRLEAWVYLYNGDTAALHPIASGDYCVSESSREPPPTGGRSAMSESARYARPPSAESQGEAPGRARLAGRRILVVGGGQRTFDAATDPIGNGRATALLCAREGAAVAVADANASSAAETVDLIRRAGGEATAIVADVSREADIVRMVGEAAGAPGGLDGVVLNVGIGVGALGLAAVTADDWDKTLAVNLRAPVLCCREALPRLADGSSIVFVSSIASLRAGSRLPAYDASKAALGGLMRHVGLEGAARGIRANVICPGLVDTPLGRMTSAGRPSRARTPVPLGRQATGWEIAYAVLFFLSEESVYVTGQTLAIDGGLTGL